jgi:hypothetical protein
VSPARSVLQGVALVAAGRFLVTPTWPCALVALGSLVLVAALEWSGSARDEKAITRMDRLRDEVVSEFRNVRVDLGESIASVAKTAADAQSRAERLEANRALGG